MTWPLSMPASPGGWRASRPTPLAVLISGGETTVTVRGSGRGGRECRNSLVLAVALDGQAGIHAMAGDTDGIDGTEDNTGAIPGPRQHGAGAAKGSPPRRCWLTMTATVSFRTGDLIVTGPRGQMLMIFVLSLFDSPFTSDGTPGESTRPHEAPTQGQDRRHPGTGQASTSRKQIEDLFQAAPMFSALNLSHGTHEDRSQGALRHHPRDRGQGRPADWRWSISRVQNCASAPFRTTASDLVAGANFASTSIPRWAISSARLCLIRKSLPPQSPAPIYCWTTASCA